METENDSGRFNLNVGVPNLIFLQRDRQGRNFADGCGHTAALSRARADMRELVGLPHRGFSYLYGGCINGDCAGLLIVARQGHGHWATRTNPNGEFLLRVPAGVYIVRMGHPGDWEADWLSYNPPNRVKVPDGGSAGVEFERRDRSR